MKKILPIPDIPSNTLICTTALGCVICNKPNAYTWLSLQCLRLQAKNSEGPEFTRGPQILYRGYIPFIDRKIIVGIEYSEILSDRKKTLDLLKNTIDDNRYIYSVWDEYFVPGLLAYDNYRYAHDYFMFGYDDESEEFSVLAYTVNRHLEHLKVNYDTMITAIEAVRGGTPEFVASLPIDSDFKITVKDFYIQFLLYMNLNVNADYTRSFNIGIYDDLLEYIYLSGKKEFDYRAFRHLFEQKKCIKHLICQIDNMIADIDFSYESSLADKCIKYADILFKLAIKYGIKDSRDTLNSMGNIVHELRNIEYQLIERLIKLLQPYAEEEIYA